MQQQQQQCLLQRRAVQRADRLFAIPQPPDDRDHRYDPFEKDHRLPLRDKLDLSSDDRWGEILHQGHLGSCVACSVAGCLAYLLRLKHPRFRTRLSRLHIYYYGRIEGGYPIEQDCGLSIRDGYKSVAKHRVCGERDWPHMAANLPLEPDKYARDRPVMHGVMRKLRYLRVTQDLIHLKTCLNEGYPISFGMKVYDSLLTDEVARTGLIPFPDLLQEETDGGHCVTLVGYDDVAESFKVANCWGPSWGDKGYGYMSYGHVMEPFMCYDFWTPRFMEEDVSFL